MNKSERESLAQEINVTAIKEIEAVKSSGISETDKLKRIDLILAISGGKMHIALTELKGE